MAGAGAEPPVVVSVLPEGAPVLPEAALEGLRAAGMDVRVRPLPRGVRSDALAEHIGADAWAVLCSWGCPTFTPEALEGMPRLRCIGYVAGSVKRLVTPEAFARGVTVLSAAPVIAMAVGEYALSVALWMLRDIGGAAAALAAAPGAEGWRRAAKLPGSRSLWGLGVGVVSASMTGRRFIELLRPFGCSVVVYDPYLPEEEAVRLGVRRGGLAEVCAQPLVSVHAPNLPSTRGLVGAQEIARIPDGAVFINSSRAGVVDYEALTAELVTGRFRAALDVFPEEPLPAGSPLYGLPHVLLTPHLAGYSTDVYARMGTEVAADVRRVALGERAVLGVDVRRWELLA